MLTFGGCPLFSGILADRCGRRFIFSAEMIWLTIWTLPSRFATSFIQIAIFRALQGIDIISSYFVACKRVVALTVFGASDSVGFCAGLCCSVALSQKLWAGAISSALQLQ
jgi:MFS family permease